VRERRLIADGDDQEIVAKVVASAKLGDIEARRLYFRFLRSPPARGATFTPKPFELRRLATLGEASEEILRVAGVVAAGELDHDTGQLIINAVKVFAETLAGVKTEREIAAGNALANRGKP
jgi:hypothetical protein